MGCKAQAKNVIEMHYKIMITMNHAILPLTRGYITPLHQNGMLKMKSRRNLQLACDPFRWNKTQGTIVPIK